MQMKMEELYQQVLDGHEKSLAELEAKREKLDERARLIEQRAIKNEEEMEKTRLEREMVIMLSLQIRRKISQGNKIFLVVVVVDSKGYV